MLRKSRSILFMRRTKKAPHFIKTVWLKPRWKKKCGALRIPWDKPGGADLSLNYLRMLAAPASIASSLRGMRAAFFSPNL